MMGGGPGSGPPGMHMTEKPKDFKGALGKLFRMMLVYRVQLAFVLVFAIGGAAFSIVSPRVMGQATTEIFNGLMGKLQGGGEGGIDFAKVGSILLNVLLLYAASSILSYAQGWIMSGLTQRAAFRLRRDLSDKLHRLPMRFFDKYTNGEILSRVTNDVDTLAMNMNQVMTQFVTSVTTVLGTLYMMLSINGWMTLVALATLPITTFGAMGIMRRSQKYFQQQQEYLGHVNGQVEEVFGGHQVVKAFNAEGEVIERFDQDNEQLAESARKSQFLSGLMMPIAMMIGNIGYVLVSIFGGILAARGSIAVGDIQAFVQYVRQFNQPITQLAQAFNMIQAMLAAAERVFGLLDEPEEIQTVEDPVSIDGLEGEVEFDRIRFGYLPEKTIIHNFSADIKPGMRVAIVGPTGAGKTTIVKLLMRFYDVDSGAIRVDSHDLRAFNRAELRDLFGMVLQDTWLFSGSIMENIRYGKLSATDEEVIQAAVVADVDHFVRTLPEGYQMELNEELSNISQGQKQLLTIARALLANPKILILDEATSSVDTRTEMRIQNAMHRLTQGRTSFIIAHRLSTIRNADLILVMKDGDIVEQGTHEGLLEAKGFYAELYQSQFAR
ncbi:MAG: ABC transporter ATP-binding protein/permease [Oscillospiraceae bacterium]|jgi:ATP-binding cassette subfamily B protein|nr:ABC transporter ATP-binding protein/permease [Oscillospiraceae bacterium]